MRESLAMPPRISLRSIRTIPR